jgi:8-oxo-dGTP pyrophosphatase MutT (NUDIX family)
MVSLERELRDRLSQPLPGAPAHGRFAPVPRRDGWAPHLRPPTARHAAALILLYPSASGPALPLTLRHRHLPHHGGQVSLPGGALNPGESPEAAAVREAEEEIGVPASAVRLVGALSTLWVGVSNFLVHPYVGLADAPPRFEVHPREVEALFEVPVADVLDAGRLHWSTRERDGVTVRFPYFDLGGQIVWGATAMVLGEFACLFDPGYAPPVGLP